MNVSALILTKNEEQDLPGCLESLAWCDEVIVFDSFSEDKTVEIARSMGATIVQRRFDDWSSHQNWGLNNIKFNNPWVLYLDADERPSSSLVAGIQSLQGSEESKVAYSIERRDFWGDVWLKHVQSTSHYVRLFKPQHVSYHRVVNPVTRVDGDVGELYGFIKHYPFSKGLDHWLARHNSYSSLEAQQLMRDHELGSDGFFTSVSAIVRADSYSERKAALKKLFYCLPFKPSIRFMYTYIVRLGFLDGKSGLDYSLLMMCYELHIEMKRREYGSASCKGGVL